MLLCEVTEMEIPSFVIYQIARLEYEVVGTCTCSLFLLKRSDGVLSKSLKPKVKGRNSKPTLQLRV